MIPAPRNCIGLDRLRKSSCGFLLRRISLGRSSDGGVYESASSRARESSRSGALLDGEPNWTTWKSAFESGVRGQGALMMLVGEPRIGKTHCGANLAHCCGGLTMATPRCFSPHPGGDVPHRLLLA